MLVQSTYLYDFARRYLLIEETHCIVEQKHRNLLKYIANSPSEFCLDENTNQYIFSSISSSSLKHYALRLLELLDTYPYVQLH